MTREELREYVEELESQGEIPYHVYSNLIDCIDTLEQEPKSEWSHDHEILRAYADGANNVLEKIRAEILEEKECAYADFERYKVEYLGQDWEDVCDNLPQDDFRYGMERCIDIIDKYKGESEEV